METGVREEERDRILQEQHIKIMYFV